MSLLGGEEIKRRLGEIFESGVDPSAVDAAAYNLRLSDQNIIIDGRKYGEDNRYPYDQHGGYIELPPRKISVVSTIEKLKLSSDLSAKVGITFSIARKGLVSLFGPQVDPGYNDHFYAVVYNVSNKPILLSRGEAILKTEFYVLAGKPMTAQTSSMGLPKDIDPRITAEDSISDIKQSVRSTEGNLKNLDERVTVLASKVEEIKGGYRSVTYFAIFLISATLFSVMFDFLLSASSNIASVIGPFATQILVLITAIITLLSWVVVALRIIGQIGKKADA